MSNCSDCTVKYYAFDRKEFKTEKECIEHNNKPRVYVIRELGMRGYGPEEIYVHKKTAEMACKRMSNQWRRFAVEAKVINVETQLETVGEKLTNTPKENWWDIFKVRGK